MATLATFDEILENLLGDDHSPSEKQASYHEEQLDLWVKVVSSSGGSQWKFQSLSPYIRMKKPKTPSQHRPMAPAPRPVQKQTLTVSELSTELLLAVEHLIRAGHVPRSDVYELNEWKKAHRTAVRSLHPDVCPDADAAEFSEIHEAFKSLTGLFKARDSLF